MTEITVPPFIFAVDTDSYAGNFEREMCAFMTGQVGECGVGQETAEAFFESFPQMSADFSSLIIQYGDDNGTRRPCTIWPTPGFYGDGMGGAYTDADDPVMVRERYQKAVRDRNERYPQSAAMEVGEPGRYPSCQSVAIFFAERPTEEMVAFLKRRANIYASTVRQKWVDAPMCTVTGFRLIAFTLHSEEEAL